MDSIAPVRTEVLDAIYAAIDRINRQRVGQKPVTKTPETALFGSASDLDSLGLVNLIVATEEQLDEVFGCALALADDRALSLPTSPFSTVQTLAAYIEVLLKEQGR